MPSLSFLPGTYRRSEVAQSNISLTSENRIADTTVSDSSRFDVFVRRWFWLFVCGLLLILSVELIGSITLESETMDEGIHLASGYSYWKTGDFRLNPEHPPLTKLLEAFPLLFLQPKLPGPGVEWRADNVSNYSHDFVYNNNRSADTLLLAGRLTTVSLTIAFGVFLAVWCRSNFGEWAALFTLFLFAIDPNIIAHGRYITSDLAISFLFFVTSVAWLSWLKHRDRFRLYRTAILFGLTMATKYSGAALVFVFIILFLIDWSRQPTRRYRDLRQLALALVIILGVGFIIVWASFGFATRPILSDPVAAERFEERFTGARHRGPLTKANANPKMVPVPKLSPGTVNALRWIGYHVPIPAHYLFLGLYKLGEHARTGHETYLLGMQGTQGWWYYFPLAILVKSPVAVEGLAILCSVMLIVYRRRYGMQAAYVWIALACPPLVYLAISCSGRLNLGLRHVLPIYSFLYVLIGAILFGQGTPRRARMWQGLALGFALLAAVEAWSTFPNYLPFFNQLAGGPAKGPRYLLDSNLDWGQDLKKLAEFRAREHQRPLCLEYRGPAEPRYYGLESQPIPLLHDEKDVATLTCDVAISANVLYSHPDNFRPLLTKSPAAMIGNSIYVYKSRRP